MREAEILQHKADQCFSLARIFASDLMTDLATSLGERFEADAIAARSSRRLVVAALRESETAVLPRFSPEARLQRVADGDFQAEVFEQAAQTRDPQVRDDFLLMAAWWRALTALSVPNLAEESERVVPISTRPADA